MSNHISESAYLQLSDSEKAGYILRLEHKPKNHNEWYKTYNETYHLRFKEMGYDTRRVYIPLPNETSNYGEFAGVKNTKAGMLMYDDIYRSISYGLATAEVEDKPQSEGINYATEYIIDVIEKEKAFVKSKTLNAVRGIIEAEIPKYYNSLHSWQEANPIELKSAILTAINKLQ